MKNWKRGLCLACALLMLCFAFAGCKQDAGDTAEESTTPTGTEGTEEIMEPEDYEGEVSIWCGWKDNFMLTWDEFAKVYPNVELNFVAVDTNAYFQKIQTSLAAGMDLPDLLLADMEWRGQMLALDIWEDLSQEPYNVDPSTILDYDIPLISNDQCDICGLETGAAVTGFAYKADLALEYFGTDDPDELFAMMPDWDSFIQKGAEVQQKSNGEVYMLTGNGDLDPVLFYQNPVPEVEDGKLVNVDEIWGEAFTIYGKMIEANIVDELGQWSPGWNASFAEDNHIFYPLPTWGASYMIKPNDPDAEGRWRIMQTPGYGNIILGGNAFGIWKESKVKEQAWKYIEMHYYSDEFVDLNLVEFNQVIPIKSIVENYDFSQFEPDPLFGGQNNIAVYTSELFDRLSYRPVNAYDQAIHDCASLVTAAMQKDATITSEAALQMFVEEVKNKIPELEIEQ